MLYYKSIKRNRANFKIPYRKGDFMRTREESLNNFIKLVDELISSKYLFANSKIFDVITAINETTAEVRAVTESAETLPSAI